MSATRTGQFGIGFRRFGEWQKDINHAIQFAKANDFACIDVGADADAVRQVLAAGLKVGSADMPMFGKALISKDKAKRDAAVAEVSETVRGLLDAGAKTFFVVMLPDDPALPRKENFAAMVEGFGPILKQLDGAGAKLAIEGWPGPGALCCTPESYRAFIKETGSPAAAINYDPSHLIRMGIDPIRFVTEFANHISHVHGKDCQVYDHRLYELGHEQPPTHMTTLGWGGGTWRYTIPGHGRMDWLTGLSVLKEAGYKGLVSIEMEDANFNGAEEGEKRGVIHARQYLESC